MSTLSLTLLFICLIFISKADDSCRVSVHHDKYDLSFMKDPYKPLETSNVNGKFEGTICNSFKLLPFTCNQRGTEEITDAVAIKDGHCEYYGRYSFFESAEYLDSKKPNKGVKLTFGGGSKCAWAGVGNAVYTTEFHITCDPDNIQFDKMLQNVEPVRESCTYIYTFRSPAGCLMNGGGGGGGYYDDDNNDESGSTSWLFTFFVLGSIALLSYCVYGAYIKSRDTGASGLDALPHIVEMRVFASEISEKSIIMFDYIKSVPLLQQTGDIISNAYNDVCASYPWGLPLGERGSSGGLHSSSGNSDSEQQYVPLSHSESMNSSSHYGPSKDEEYTVTFGNPGT